MIDATSTRQGCRIGAILQGKHVIPRRTEHESLERKERSWPREITLMSHAWSTMTHWKDSETAAHCYISLPRDIERSISWQCNYSCRGAVEKHAPGFIDGYSD